jgi:NitT/TauT family transport system ATP-binding protein
VIEARGLRKVYASRRGAVTALDGLDLSAAAGEFVAVVGPSGCGKSTLLYILGGFIRASGGEVTVDGAPVAGPDPRRGIVFQEFALFPWKTVLGNVTYGLAEQRVPRRERAERARAYLDMVHLSGFERHYPKELSGGMRQRVALARALIVDPDILLMDEPFGAVDAQTRVVLQQELLQIWERTRKTVVFVTHSVDEALFLSDRVYVLSHRPARVKEVVDVGLPRPRDPEAVLGMPEYRELHRDVWALLRG